MFKKYDLVFYYRGNIPKKEFKPVVILDAAKNYHDKTIYTCLHIETLTIQNYIEYVLYDIESVKRIVK